jgi:hypothetical protein
MLAALQSASREDCIQIGNAAKLRLQRLGNAPDPLIARRVRTSKTATIVVKGESCCGQIEERTTLSVVLRFSDGNRLFCQLADLVPDGFDKPETVMAPAAVPAVFRNEGSFTPNLHLFNGVLYHIDSANETIAEGRRIYYGEREPLPTPCLVPFSVRSDVEL